MTEKEYDALMEVIEAKIDEEIERALGRDGLYESIGFARLQSAFKREFLKEGGE